MAAHPNIVFILADDMGYGDFSVFNGGRSDTPSLDRLVGESVCLTQHYSASPVCAPARAGLLTGRYPHRSGAIDTFEGRGLDRIALRETTLADLFNAAGYRTGLVGKWHCGALDVRYHPNARGFDEFIGFQGGWQDYYGWRLDYNGKYQKNDGRYLTEVFTDEAIEFVKRNYKQPFFLHLSYNAPHFPMQAPDEYVRKYVERGFNHGVALVYAMIEYMDQGIERILETIRQTGIENNTIVIFTSDNGPDFGGEGEMSKERFNCQFNGSKGNVYEGGIRLPLTMRWPDGLDGGRYLDPMTHLTDWFPTLLAAAGITIPQNLRLDGRNILPVLRCETDEVNPRRFWQWNRYTPVINANAAMRDGDWKLVRPDMPEVKFVSPEDLAFDIALKYHPELFHDISRIPEPERKMPTAPPPQLFNIKDDPGEQNDLAEADPGRVDRMLIELEDWFRDVEADRVSIR
ncbi:MAG: sulfatase-like hydrolase/transferase [Anaerolineaceae bacterium]|nr:sulfatase-like hydrolase/transferase [Anaerolineaceae bacterium]